MAEQQSVARKRARSKKQEADPRTGKSGKDDDVAKYEQELAAYLQDRIKPGLNSGAIPLLARSIAKDIAHREHPNGAPETAPADDESKGKAEAEDEAKAEAGDEPTAEADDAKREGEADGEPSAEADDEESAESEAPPDFEADMRELQSELGEDWILRFSVHGDDGWLTAEREDGSQRLEAPEASVLVEAVGLLNERGGRSS
jgi:hypothetical protein